MIADMIVFAIMAYYYVPYQPPEANKTEDLNEEKSKLNGNSNKEEPKGKNGIPNDGFNEEDTKFWSNARKV